MDSRGTEDELSSTTLRVQYTPPRLTKILQRLATTLLPVEQDSESHHTKWDFSDRRIFAVIMKYPQ